jgi:dTDP-4-dehydrorhamnose 3,5-epimerase
VLILEPKVFGDERGYFMETYRANATPSWASRRPWSRTTSPSRAGACCEGLHIQHPHAQGKLVQVLDGEVFDVAVDVRRGSPTFGRWVGVSLSGENKRQLWIPPGFAHGFLVTSETALFVYKNTDYYSPETEFSVRWDDPDIGIDWPLDGTPELSPRTRERLSERHPTERLPAYEDYDHQATTKAGVRPRILLIGANGQVGWELRRTLAALGEVIAASSRGNTARRSICWIRNPWPGWSGHRGRTRWSTPPPTRRSTRPRPTAVAQRINADAVGELGALLAARHADHPLLDRLRVLRQPGSALHGKTMPRDPLNVYGETKLGASRPC